MSARIVTILFTDLVGYTELTERLGDEAAEDARRVHFALLREAVTAHGGEEVKSLGDGLMVVFPSAVEALGCALDMQQASHRRNRRPGSPPLDVRIGLHVGEPIPDEDDYFGTSVNIAKRLCDHAEGGQILVSDLIRGLVGGRGGFTFHAVGEIALRGIAEPIGAYELTWSPTPGAELDLPVAIASGPRSPFAGRQAEWTKLLEHWKRAAIGERHAVLIAGEPGIGKTRLATELARSAHREGAIVLYGRCDAEAHIPYQPFVEALRHYVTARDAVALADELADAAPDLARLVPEILERLPETKPPQREDPEVERYRLFRAVGRALAEATRSAPLVLVLDDLHWADGPTLALLKHVLRSPEPASVLIVGTYRHAEVGRRHPLGEVLMTLRREGLGERIRLGGFSADEVETFLEKIAEQELDGGGRIFARALHAETQGNPFFIEEILLHLVETGRLYQGEGDRWTSDVRSIDELGIPESVREAVGLRLAHLRDETVDVLTKASVLGSVIDLGVLREMTALEEDALVDALDDALEKQLLVELPDGGTLAYTFVHAIVRQVLYDGISEPRRQRLHARAADAITAAHGGAPPATAVAVHYRAAKGAADVQKAIDASLDAGRQAAAVYAYEDAADHLRGALELLDAQNADPAFRAQLRANLADLMWITGLDYAQGFRWLEEAERLSNQAGEDVLAAQMHSRIGRGLSTFDTWMNIDAAFEHFAKAEEVLGRGPARLSLGHTYVGLASAAIYGMRTVLGHEAANRAMEIAEQLGSDSLWGTATMLRGWHAWASGQLAEGERLIAAAWAAADRLDHPTLGFFTAWMHAFIAEMLLDPRDGEVWCAREVSRPRAAEAPTQRAILQLHHGMLKAMAGDLGDLRAIHEIAGADAPVVTNVQQQFLTYYQGDWDASESVTADARDHRRKAGNKLELGATGRTHAATLRTKGDFEGVVAILEETLENARGQVAGRELIEIPELAVALAQVDRGDDARVHLARARELLDSGEDWRGLAGWVAWAEGVVEGNEDHFRRAVEILGKYESVWEEAEAYLWWGRSSGDSSHFDAAEDIYRKAGAGEPFIDRVRAWRTA